MVYRIYVEKKKELANEAKGVLANINGLLQISSVKDVRVINRYDVENIEKDLFDYAVNTVFSEPQLDIATNEIDTNGATVFATEYLPGQYDQRADSAAQCIQIISQKERPTVKTAKVYCLYGDISDEELAAIKKYLINPVESREATLELYETLKVNYDIPTMNLFLLMPLESVLIRPQLDFGSPIFVPFQLYPDGDIPVPLVPSTNLAKPPHLHLIHLNPMQTMTQTHPQLCFSVPR